MECLTGLRNSRLCSAHGGLSFPFARAREKKGCWKIEGLFSSLVSNLPALWVTVFLLFYFCLFMSFGEFILISWNLTVSPKLISKTRDFGSGLVDLLHQCPSKKEKANPWSQRYNLFRNYWLVFHMLILAQQSSSSQEKTDSFLELCWQCIPYSGWAGREMDFFKKNRLNSKSLIDSGT